MGVNSLPKTVTRQRRGCNLNPGPSAPESSTLTTRLPSHPRLVSYDKLLWIVVYIDRFLVPETGVCMCHWLYNVFMLPLPILWAAH